MSSKSSFINSSTTYLSVEAVFHCAVGIYPQLGLSRDSLASEELGVFVNRHLEKLSAGFRRSAIRALFGLEEVMVNQRVATKDSTRFQIDAGT